MQQVLPIVTRHMTRTLVAGIVALLPIAGVVVTAAVAEKTVAESWLSNRAYYFPGLGLLAVVALTYALGLTVTTFIGRFAWRSFDRILEQLPALGALYKTLKQVLGYGEGKDGMFERVVLVPGRDHDAQEIGLVTRTVSGVTGTQLTVFVPAAPSPTSGRVILIDEARTTPLPISVHEALKFLVAVGKVELESAVPSRAP